MALSVKSRMAGLGYAKKIVLALIQPFGFALTLTCLLSDTVHHSHYSFCCCIQVHAPCTLKLFLKGTCVVSPVLRCHTLMTQGNAVLSRNPSRKVFIVILLFNRYL